MRATDCSFTSEPLEPRRLLAGITIITHGWNGTTTGWVSTMATAIAKRVVAPGGNSSDVTQYTVTASGSPVTIQLPVRETGSATWGTSGEAIIKFNWSSLAGGVFSGTPTGVVADALANYLFANQIDGHSVFEVPIHLIGHSRGASLMVQLARRLAERGVWVDQFTSLDPHPVDGVREPLGNDFGDTPMSLWDNVVFADNYWHNGSGLVDFTGEAVTGARNLGPLSLPGGGSIDHSDVHAFYYGTIDRSATADGDGINLNPAWYTGIIDRATEGYDRSRIGRGTHWTEGVSSLDHGSASRVHVALTTTSPWSDVGSLSITGDSGGLIASGQNISLNYRYQAISGGGTISFHVDDDTSPYDGSVRSMGTTATLAPTGATPGAADGSLAGTWSSSGLSSGLYHLYAAITDTSGHVRYAYMTQPLFVTAAGVQIVTKQWTANIPGDNQWTNPANWTPGGLPGSTDRVLINAASDVTLTGGAGVQSLLVSDSAHLKLPAGANEALVAGSLEITGAATLDLTDNAMILDYTGGGGAPMSQVRQYLQSGRLFTSSATAQKRLGYADNALLGKTTFAGQSVDPTSVLVKYTYAGDADFDGDADGVDIGTWATNFTGELGGSGTSTWSQGDWDYDGDVDGVDAGLWAQAFTGELGGTGLRAPNPIRKTFTRPASLVLLSSS